MVVAVITLMPARGEGHTCRGTMDHWTGDFPIKYKLDRTEECPLDYVGYVKYWGPGIEAWTEGTYNWECDSDRRVKLLRMRFAEEMKFCRSFDGFSFNCWSDMSPLEWQMDCVHE